MEAAGLYAAATVHKVDWYMVKGICDWGMGKNKKYQQDAAISAFDFALHTLDRKGVGDYFREQDGAAKVKRQKAVERDAPS